MILINIICLYTVKWFKYDKWLNILIWPIDGTLTSATTPNQYVQINKEFEGVVYIPQSSMTAAWQSGILVSYPGNAIVVWIWTLCRDAVSLFDTPIWLGGWLCFNKV